MDPEDVRPPAPHGASPDGPVGGAGGAFAFDMTTDWKQLGLEIVRKHPLPCLFGAFAAGFFLGRYQGKNLMSGAVTLASRAAIKQLQQVLTPAGG